ncbi:MAG: VOC family protein [Thermomicrobiales bacterium]|nr:VOC family protein [Thermomicrobiales bacterium]
MPRLVHVGIAATDLDATVRFWRDGLGLEVVQEIPGCVDLTDGHHNFRLFPHQLGPRPAHVGGLSSYLHVGVYVPDLAGAVRRFEALGHPIIWDGVDHGHPPIPGVMPSKSFKVEDPDGIVVDVTASDDQWPGVS